MSKQIVKIKIPTKRFFKTKHTHDESFISEYRQLLLSCFGINSNELYVYQNESYMVVKCTLEQFAMFIIERCHSTCPNMVEELSPELVEHECCKELNVWNRC